MSLANKRRKLVTKCAMLFDELLESADENTADRWIKSVYDLAKLDKQIEESTDAKMRQTKGEK